TQGRHRYYRLADPLVARALESIMTLAAQGPHRHRPHGPADLALKHARTCYDHLAGQVGVGLLTVLLGRGHLAPGPRDYRVTPSGKALFAEFGIDLADVERQRRSFARPCLDWSERRPHLAGALGAALAGFFDDAPKLVLAKALRRFKSLAEAGEMPTTAKNPSARES
nr:hypothetical protein [Actinomycetota bacterium]